jgi:tetratricopeptide (TPR) repeat protein
VVGWWNSGIKNWPVPFPFLLRADERYTNFAIWCKKICANIRQAKYLIVDTSGKNPNVFYELGFAHALENTRTILITQNIEEAPFDIRDLNHIVYSQEKLRDLEKKLRAAIEDLEAEKTEEGYQHRSSDEVIMDLKGQLRQEEERADRFKKERYESEEREQKLKEQIREMEAIRDNPVQEAQKQITDLEGTIAGLKSKLRFTEKSKGEEIRRLQDTLKTKEEKLKNLEQEFKRYQTDKDNKKLSETLMEEIKKKTEAVIWYSKSDNETDHHKKIEYYSKAIELNSEYTNAYINRGNVYCDLKSYERAIEDYNKATEIKPDHATAYLNLAEVYVITGQYEKALETIKKLLTLSLEVEDKAIGLYLECVARRMLNIDVAECEAELDKIPAGDFKITWDFESIETWIQETSIDAAQKDYIRQITERMKKHKAN